MSKHAVYSMHNICTTYAYIFILHRVLFIFCSHTDEECDASYKKRIKKKPMKDKQEEDEEEHERKLKSPKLGM